MRKRKKNDKMGIGFMAGILLPLVIFVFIHYTRYPDVPLIDYAKDLWEMKVFIKIMSLCVFPNLLVFLLYIRRKKDAAARGVLAATFVYALLVLISQVL